MADLSGSSIVIGHKAILRRIGNELALADKKIYEPARSSI
jgi:hypothetical protein